MRFRTEKEAIKNFRIEFPNVKITAINDIEIIGWCETCSFPILADENRGPYTDCICAGVIQLIKQMN